VVTPLSFRIIPVIDLKGGMAVHAIGGRRDQYRPLCSIWQATAAPRDLVGGMREGLGIDGLYVADLDAIEGRPPDLALYRSLAEDGLEIWLDAGVRDRQSILPLMGLDRDSLQVVVGLESVRGPEALAEIVECAGRDRVIFSVDLDRGRARVAPGSEWPDIEPLEIASLVVEVGVRRLILLDLARVGTGLGIGTELFLGKIRTRYPGAAITVGGGIRGVADVLAVADRGASAVLVGSAIHDGRIGRRELERIASFTAKRC
jgi:phosphoribosylformimino-5-aminoimidazole carboxamide ribotide isomerase